MARIEIKPSFPNKLQLQICAEVFIYVVYWPQPIGFCQKCEYDVLCTKVHFTF